MATRIFVGDLGDIAPITIFAETKLETAVGGESSIGNLVIKDIGQARADFVPMARVTVDRGAGTDPIYSGYLIKPSRRFWFDVDDPDKLQRKWVLWCADINLLWSRRIIYDKSNPPNITGPKYTVDTYDDDVLAELFANWVDLSFDDLDVSTKVDRVGLINYDQVTYPFNPSETLGEAVATIAQLPAAVYGINSKREVVYADVDDENAPFVLSDAYLPPNNPPAGQLSTTKAGAVAIVNPPIGRSTYTIPTDELTDPTDPAEQADWTGQQGPTVWAKLVLETNGFLRFDTAGSSLEDTVLWLYQQENPPGPDDVAFLMDDDSARVYLEEMRFHGAYAVWEFAETSGTTATDWSEAGGHSAIYRNSPTLNQAGPGPGVKSVLFNGTSQYADAAGTSIFGATATSTLSWACWVKHNGTHGAFYDTIFGKGVGGPQIKLTPEGRIGLAKADEGDLALTLNPVITDTNWHHVIVTWESGVGVSVYIDGAAVAMGSFTNRTFVSNSSRFSIASASGAVWSDGWHGSLAMPGVFDKILSASEAQRLYNNVISRHEILPSFGNTIGLFAGTFWIAIQSFSFSHDPWEDQITLNIIRGDNDVVPEPDPGWTPEGTPGAEVVGYRDPLIIPDGTQLANDVMAWGFGMGAPRGVFKRLRDTSSIEEHGLWQDAVTLYSVYKQATINKVADSMVNGSPGSRRGRKDDKISVTCTIFRDGLHVGDRVRYISHLYRFEDVIPVRKMVILFPTPDDVQYDLTLSHEIDRWGFQDPLPPFPIPGPYPIEIPEIVIVDPPPNDPSCVEAMFAIDAWNNRNVALHHGPSITWETGGSGIVWVSGGTANTLCKASVSTSTQTATMTVVNATLTQTKAYNPAAPWNRDVVTGKFRFQLSAFVNGYEMEFTFGPARIDLSYLGDEFTLNTATASVLGNFSDWGTPGDWYVIEVGLNLEDELITARVYREGGAAAVQLQHSSDGERVTDGTYQPTVAVLWRNPTPTAVTFTASPWYCFVYADAIASQSDVFEWSDWTEYIGTVTSGDDPGIAYEEGGRIRITDSSLVEGGHIRKTIPEGATVELAFSVSGYSSSSDILWLWFGMTGSTRTNIVGLGNDAFVFWGPSGSGFNRNYFNSLFTSLEPVNVRIQSTGGSVRMKLWAGGTAEPDDWTVEAVINPTTASTTDWPLPMVAIEPHFFATGDEVILGPLQLDTGESPDWLMIGPDTLAKSPGKTGTLSTDSLIGRRKVWGFTNPGGTSASFPPSSYVNQTVTTPSFAVGMAWPIFNPIVGHGSLNEINQNLAAIRFPPVLYRGSPINYAVLLRGRANMTIGPAKRDDLGATGEPLPVFVQISQYEYGITNFSTTTPTPPSFVDYNIAEGIPVWGALFDAFEVGSNQSMDFAVVLNNEFMRIDSDGTHHVQWGGYFYGTEGDMDETIEAAGPLWGGIFLVTGNNGSMQLVLNNLSYEIVPTSLGYVVPPGTTSTDPCPDDPLGNDYGTPEKGEICTLWLGEADGVDGVVDDFPMPGKFVPGSCKAIVNGITLTPGEHFTETAGDTEVHFASPPTAGAVVYICCTVL